MTYVYLVFAVLVGLFLINLMNTAAEAPRSTGSDRLLLWSILTFLFVALSVYLVLRG